MRSGAAFVNALVASDARLPFGGTRAGGHGRELAAAGIREFVDVRTWWVLDEPAGAAPVSGVKENGTGHRLHPTSRAVAGHVAG